MYPNLYPNRLCQPTIYCCPVCSQLNYPMRPYSEKTGPSGFRYMRSNEGSERISGPGMQMPQGGQGNFGFFQPGIPGQMQGSTTQGAPGMPMQQMMNPQQMLQSIERNNPDIINAMTNYNIPITTARQIILSIIQAVQSNMQLGGS